LIERRVRVADPAGLHLRQAARIVQLASRFESRVLVRQAGREADARSVIGILGLAVAPATEVTLAAEGTDAEEALAALAAEVESGPPPDDSEVPAGPSSSRDAPDGEGDP
jgi:phosphotransferase system HPr (HPr) family protein